MSSMTEARVPNIGDFKNVPVVEIPVKVGDTVAVGDTLVVVESDKATLDVPSDVAGVIAALKVAMGDPVSQGTVLAVIEFAAVAAASSQAHISTPVVAEPIVVALTAPVAAAPEPATTAEGLPPHASPTIRKLSREMGVDLARLAGTGPKGRITREDVQIHVKAALSGVPQQTGGIGAGLPAWPRVDYAKFGSVTRKPLSRIRRLSGPALARNVITIPHVTNFDEADVTDLEAFRKTANAEGGVKLSILPFVVKAAVGALKAYPAFNSSLDGDDVVLKNYWNIGVAADTPDGLVVPVIKDADKKGLRAIAAEMAELAADARAGKLKSTDMQGATFTISSLGGVGGTNFTPIINAPEVAILGMTRAAIKPIWDGQTFLPRLIQPLSLSWDHRVVDGVAAARFLGHLSALLADFRRVSL